MTQRKPSARYSKAFPSRAALLIAALAIALLAYEMRGFSSVHEGLADFHAFYCAGSALAHGADPYRTAALAACEHAAQPWGLYSAPGNLVLPAPLPPYAITLFAALAFLPYPVAAVVWFALLVAAVLGAGSILIGALRIPGPAVAAMLLLPAAVLWVPFGELAPFALLGAAIASSHIDRSPALAALGFALLAFEPHLAVGVWVCAVLLVPRMRVPLLLTGFALAAVSAAAHPGSLVEYVREVLPVHALAELPRPSQYSAAWIVYALGAPAQAALAAGAASACAMLIGGILVARQLKRRWCDNAAIVFAPLAASVIGGTFVHASQIVLALPLAALVATREHGKMRMYAALACALLLVPWAQAGTQIVVLLAAAAAAASLTWSLCAHRAIAVRALLGVLACAAIVTLASHQRRPVSHAAGAFAVPSSEQRLASAQWGGYVWAEQSTATLADWAAKAPAWFALLLVIGSAARAAADKEPETRVAIRQTPVVP